MSRIAESGTANKTWAQRAPMILAGMSLVAFGVALGIDKATWAGGFGAVFCALMLHEWTAHLFRRYLGASSIKFSTGLLKAMGLRFVGSLILVGGYVLAGFPEPVIFALVYGSSYLAAGVYEASLMKDGLKAAGG